MNNMMQRKQ
uniref:Uncharacterized protein n=1 Tax=Arundo donax TaxID=35708 RepID=A0A0A9BTY9_ARUDO